MLKSDHPKQGILLKMHLINISLLIIEVRVSLEIKNPSSL